MFLFVAAAALAQSTCPEASWPAAEWPTDLQASDALDAHLFPPELDRADKERRGTRTDGVVVVHRGRIIYERYGGGYEADTPHLAWSATKSFTNALVGMAVGAGKVKLDDGICAHILELPDAACAVTVEDLLAFASGFDWLETYEGYSPTQSSVLAMLYGEGTGDMARFTAGHGLRDTPGTTWMYSSGDTNVLSLLTRTLFEDAHGEHYPFALLLDPIGMTHTTWERDGSGTYVGSSYLYAPPRDLARFGYLLLQDGCWEGERLLPEGWVASSTEVSEPFAAKPMDFDGGPVQGRQFWLNRAVPPHQPTRPWPSVPDDAFAALGHWKQSITVIPSADLVVVRTADDRDGTYDHDRTLALAIALAHGTEPPAAAPPPAEAPGTVSKTRSKRRKYDNGLFQLASGFSSKEVCSCTFVMGRDEDFCAEWTRVSPDVAKFKIDTEAKRVRARALGMGKTWARHVDARTGCVIEAR